MTKDEKIKAYNLLFERIKKALPKMKVFLNQDRSKSHNSTKLGDPDNWIIHVHTDSNSSIDIDLLGAGWGIIWDGSFYKKQLNNQEVLPELKKTITAVKNGLEYDPKTRGFIMPKPAAKPAKQPKPKPAAKPTKQPKPKPAAKPKAKPKNAEPQPPTKRVENKIATREKRVTKTQDELAQLKKELEYLKRQQKIVKI